MALAHAAPWQIHASQWYCVSQCIAVLAAAQAVNACSTVIVRYAPMPLPEAWLSGTGGAEGWQETAYPRLCGQRGICQPGDHLSTLMHAHV